MDEREVEFLAQSTWESEDHGIRWVDADVRERDRCRRLATRMLLNARAQAAEAERQ